MILIQTVAHCAHRSAAQDISSFRVTPLRCELCPLGSAGNVGGIVSAYGRVGCGFSHIGSRLPTNVRIELLVRTLRGLL